MNNDNLVIVDTYDIHLKNKRELNLRSTLVIPSAVHSYSVSVEYMKNWFLDKFGKNYFNPDSIFISGKHVYDDARRFDKTKSLKRENPLLVITPTPDFTFDRDGVDLYLGGLDLYIKRSRYEDSFFKDYDHKLFIQANLEANLISFIFKVRVDTKAQQLDLYKFMKIAFRLGSTQGEYISLDLHVPFDLMLQLAYDAGFEVDLKEKIIKDNIEFLRYLNTRSEIPFMYKLRCVNGRNEYFTRIDNFYTHIRATELTLDDGDRVGQLDMNFGIEMTCELRIGAPQSYVYFSKEETAVLEGVTREEQTLVGLHSIKIADIPNMNDKKWNVFIKTEYDETDRSKPLEIDLSALFTGDLKKFIEYNEAIHISPNAFMEIKLYNGGYEKEIDVDWSTNILKTKDIMDEDRSVLGVYLDLYYFNTNIINAKELYDSRYDKIER